MFFLKFKENKVFWGKKCIKKLKFFLNLILKGKRELMFRLYFENILVIFKYLFYKF